MSELQRLAVFIDYQNAYHGARQAQGATEESHFTVGQFDPLKLGCAHRQYTPRTKRS